jgi:hypothetical protein
VSIFSNDYLNRRKNPEAIPGFFVLTFCSKSKMLKQILKDLRGTARNKQTSHLIGFSMKASLIALFTCLALASIDANGQHNKNTIGVELSANFLARQDLIFSPVIHKTWSVSSLGIMYQRTGSLTQTVKLRYANMNPMILEPFDFIVDGEQQTAYPHSFNLLNLTYTLGKKIKETERVQYTVGPLFSTDIQVMNYEYGRISSFGYYAGLSLGAYANQTYKLNERSWLSTTLQLPLITWLARSPYLVNDDEFIENISSHSGLKAFAAFMADGKLVTVNKVQTLDADIRYFRSIGKRWQIGAGYSFGFIHASIPKSLLSYRHSLNLSTNFKFLK